MKFSRDNTTDVTIRKVEPHSIRIGDETFSGSVVLTSERILRDWSVPGIDTLEADDLQPLADLDPEMIIVGTGTRQVLAPSKIVFAMARRGIGIEFMDTPAACRTFNILVGEGRRPAALLIMDGDNETGPAGAIAG